MSPAPGVLGGVPAPEPGWPPAAGGTAVGGEPLPEPFAGSAAVNGDVEPNGFGRAEAPTSGSPDADEPPPLRCLRPVESLALRCPGTVEAVLPSVPGTVVPVRWLADDE